MLLFNGAQLLLTRYLFRIYSKGVLMNGGRFVFYGMVLLATIVVLLPVPSIIIGGIHFKVNCTTSIPQIRLSHWLLVEGVTQLGIGIISSSLGFMSLRDTSLPFATTAAALALHAAFQGGWLALGAASLHRNAECSHLHPLLYSFSIFSLCWGMIQLLLTFLCCACCCDMDLCARDVVDNEYGYYVVFDVQNGFKPVTKSFVNESSALLQNKREGHAVVSHV